MYGIICRFLYCILQIYVVSPPRSDAILSEKSGKGFSRFYFRGIKASAEERAIDIQRFPLCNNFALPDLQTDRKRPVSIVN